MNSNKRLHSVLLTLWDIARDNPNYNRKLWGELQVFLSNLEMRNNLLCALLADLLHQTDDEGRTMWNEATAQSPPEGFAVKFMHEELRRIQRPQMPRPQRVIPVGKDGRAIDPTETPSTTFSLDDDRVSDDLIVPVNDSNDLPIGVDDEYDVSDESDDSEDHLAFEFDWSSSEDSSE